MRKGAQTSIMILWKRRTSIGSLIMGLRYKGDRSTFPRDITLPSHNTNPTLNKSSCLSLSDNCLPIAWGKNRILQTRATVNSRAPISTMF